MPHNSDFFSKEKSLATINRGKRWTRYKIVAFLICLIISFALWYLVGYSQKETSHFSLSVQAVECPPKYILMEQSEKEITFQAQSFLHDLDKIKRKNKLTIDLSNIHIEKVKGRYQGVLPVEPSLQKFLRQINYKGYFESPSPDTIVFFFETPIKKKLPVSLNIQYNIADQYRQYTPTTISPQTVTIEGRKEIVETIDSIKTVFIRLGTIKESFNQMVALEKYPLLHLSHDSVHVFIPVTEVPENQSEI
jgi:hypothetical protein